MKRPAFLDRLFAPPSKAESEREARCTAIQQDIEARLAKRKARRLVTNPAARKGWATRRTNHV